MEAIRATSAMIVIQNYLEGTSAATPIVAGVVALILEANPNLTWRDVRLILAQSARKNHASDGGWSSNGALDPSGGYSIHHSYGFGVVDAAAALSKALNWTLVGSQIVAEYPTSGVQTVNTSITDNSSTGISDTITISSSTISKIEYIELTLNATHNDWGELAITLSRSGGITTSSTLSVNHNCLSSVFGTAIDCTVSGNSWVFGISRHLGETPNGNWTLKVADTTSGVTGTFDSWRLKIYGE